MNKKIELKENVQSDKSRREFLKGAVVAGSAAAIVASTGNNAMASEVTESKAVSKKAKGYEETQHVRDYYDSARN